MQPHLLFAAPFLARPQGPPRDLPFHSLRARDLQLRACRDLFVNARHAKKDVRSHFLETLAKLLNIRREIDGGSNRQWEMDRDHALGDMRQRQVGEGAVALGYVPELLDEASRRGQGAMAQLHRFRWAGCAGCVNEAANIARLDRLQAAFELVVEPAVAKREKGFPRHLQRIVRWRALHHDDMTKHVQLRALLCDPLEMLFLLGQQDLALRMIDDVGRILGGRGEIDAGRPMRRPSSRPNP